MRRSSLNTKPEIPFLDLANDQGEIGELLEEAMTRVLRRGTYILGPEVQSFEREFAAYIGATHCIGVANGLEALFLILAASGIGPGDEVIVPSNTYVATALAATHTGATVVFADPVAATHNLDPVNVEKAISPKTRAIIAVHLYGLPAPMDELRAVIGSRPILLIEDAAQAHGAEYHGRKTGTLGDAAGFSFYPTKNLGALGDGGAIVTNDSKLAERVKLLRNYGSARKGLADLLGFNSRLDELQAAILRVKLSFLDRWNVRRAMLAQAYAEALEGTSAVLQTVPPGSRSCYHLYVIRSGNRDAVIADLTTSGIQAMIHYPFPPHLQPAYAANPSCWRGSSVAIAERLAEEIISLPMNHHLTPGFWLRTVRKILSRVGGSPVERPGRALGSTPFLSSTSH